MSLPNHDINYADTIISVDKDLLLSRLRQFHPEHDPANGKMSSPPNRFDKICTANSSAGDRNPNNS